MRGARRTRQVSALLVGLVAWAAYAGIGTAPAGAQQPFGEAAFGGYATGTIVHADALDTGSVRLVDVEVGHSAAVVDSEGLDEPVQNEVGRRLSAAEPDRFSHAQSASVEAGIALSPPGADDQVRFWSEASAPPSSELVTHEFGRVDLDPVAWANLLRTQAQARWNPSSCVAGADMAYGLSYAADVQLLDAGGDDAAEGLDHAVVGTDATNPQRAVGQSVSRVALVPQVARDGRLEGDDFGLMSETRMTIAPVTLDLIPIVGEQLTIEFLGEWVLRAVATGHSGWVHFGPGEVSPQTPLLRVLGTAGNLLGLVTSQDLLGVAGLVVPIPDLGIEIAIGEDPRAIGGDATSKPVETAAEASAAIDVVRVRLLDRPAGLGLSLADVRIGHMEARATVPKGGIRCDLPVTKTADPPKLSAGENFVYTITVTNPFDCTLTNVSLVDKATGDPGVRFQVGQQDPPATSVEKTGFQESNVLRWSDIGPIAPHQSRVVRVAMDVAPDSAAGVITDDAEAAAKCEVATPDGSARTKVPVSGRVTVRAPEVTAGAQVAGQQVRRGPPELPRTGGALATGIGAFLLTSGLVLNRVSARATRRA